MPLNHSKATVRISLAGLALVCINKREHNRCEIGILRCDRHAPVLDIQKIELDSTRTKRKSSCLVEHSLCLDDDIFIDVINPAPDEGLHCERGTSTFLRRGFDREDDHGDEEDFRWIPDLEGPEFHNRKLKFRRKAKLMPKIFLSDGILYTRRKTDDAFARVSVNGGPSPAVRGRFGHGMSADITCLEGGKVVLSNRSDNGSSKHSPRCSVTLPHDDRFQYVITLENHCQLANEFEGTDFRLYYDVIKDPGGKQFDLRRIVKTGCYAAPEDPIAGRADFSLDGFPQRCMTVSLSETGSLGGESSDSDKEKP